MSIRKFKDALIPEIKSFCDVMVIEAEQPGGKPEGAHITYKITSPFIKGVGQAEEVGREMNDSFQIVRTESFLRVISFSAYDLNMDVSHDLAQRLHDWFSFHGYNFLNGMNIVVVDLTSVHNRDVFLFERYERRNGFDVTLRMTREVVIADADYFDTVIMEREDEIE